MSFKTNIEINYYMLNKIASFSNLLQLNPMCPTFQKKSLWKVCTLFSELNWKKNTDSS
jgi:hypothetical protein